MILKTVLHVENLLKQNEKFIDKDGNIFIQNVLEAIEKIDKDLVKLLISDEKTREQFFIKIDDVFVLEQNKLIEFFTMNEYFNNSFTSYTNKIGLIKKDSFIKKFDDVVLAWPHKDCVLEGGQSRDDEKNNEVFYNEILSRDEIDRLFEPKALTNIKRYTKDGMEENPQISEDDNLIIKGNNLIALHSLKRKYAGKVKLIYIDPPYNTGNDSFKYNDRFNHSTWLTFMKNRLEVAREFLSEDGAIFVQCDDNEQAYLKVLMDEIFQYNFINLITIKTKIAGVSGSSEGNSLQDNCEYINVYAKNKNLFKLEKILYDKIELYKYIEDYRLNGKSWKYTTVLDGVDNGEYIKSIKAGNGEEIKIFRHKKYSFLSINQVAKDRYKNDLKKAYYSEISKIFRTTNAQSSIRQRIIDENLDYELLSIEYIPIKGKNKGVSTKLYYKDDIRNLITFLADVVSIEDKQIYKLEKKGTLWDTINYNNLTKDGDVKFENGKKPEELLKMIIELVTNENDLIMDFHLGSGTTCAVAHKMGRRYIGIEQMDYIEDIAVERMKKVLDGEQGGVSKALEWSGGGSFIYAELKQIDNFKDAEIGKLNANMHYLPVAEIEDTEYNMSEEEIAINKKFYGFENE